MSESSPAFTFAIVVPSVPLSVIAPSVASSYATKVLVTAPLLSTFAPSARNCDRFTASVLFVAFATLMIWRSEPAAPTDTVFARSASEFAPSATELAAVALAAPPIATASIPVAEESASVEFAWKYLMPPPSTTMLLMTLPMFVTLPATFARLPATLATFAFVSYSWLPFTASRLLSESSPAFTFAIVVPSVPLSVIAPSVLSSYATKLFVRLPLSSMFMPNCLSWPTLTASLSPTPLATFDSVTAGAEASVPPSVSLS
ncbi:hypothetical protein LMG27177_04887 [Paraburkholderia fynbosensis]|uniref:Uncharacterized protein n=1 Tax=Paraburkholderia fynbosensis TaxID=1200993 RepID=A0A6J5GJS4_9BURK|nr:hypothetical protein LMG27177_04887 [Paraburkholderia fynbosensis]